MMASVTEYYIVPKETFEKCSDPQQSVAERLENLPRKARSNSVRLLDLLKSQIKWDNLTGITPGLTDSIFNYISYSVRGKQRPLDFEEFLPYITSVPASVLCEKVKREVTKYKRRHGRQVRASRVDKLKPYMGL